MDIYIFPNPLEFSWDSANAVKSYSKHGIANSEAEECFFNLNLVLPDEAHSQTEKRFQLLGKNNGGVILFIVFTLRNNQIRIISARKANLKERSQYENFEKNSSI